MLKGPCFLLSSSFSCLVFLYCTFSEKNIPRRVTDEMANKYGKLEEDWPPNYSDIAGGGPACPPAAAAPPVTVHTGAPVHPAPPGWYAIQPKPGTHPGAQPVVDQPRVIYVHVQAPVISEQEAPDHLAMAIWVTICCSIPFGVLAILRAMESRKARMRGDRVNAVFNAEKAKKFSMIGLVKGMVMIVLIKVYLITKGYF